MRCLLVLIFALKSGVTVAQAQVFADFGEPSPADFEMKTCAFEPNASAVVLIHEAISNYNDQYNLITNHHYRIKILKESGLSHASVSIPFYPDKLIERIEDLE